MRKFDAALIAIMVVSYTAGQFVAADKLSMVAGAALVVFFVRLLLSWIGWIATGR